MKFSEMRDQARGIEHLADLEEEHEAAKAAFMSDKSAVNKGRFQAAKAAFAAARAEWRAAEEAAGRRTPGAGVGGGDE